MKRVIVALTLLLVIVAVTNSWDGIVVWHNNIMQTYRDRLKAEGIQPMTPEEMQRIVVDRIPRR